MYPLAFDICRRAQMEHSRLVVETALRAWVARGLWLRSTGQVNSDILSESLRSSPHSVGSFKPNVQK